jgi:hypothetical protein
MKGFGPETRALLERARTGHAPASGAKDRVRRTLEKRLGVGLAAAAGLTTTTSALGAGIKGVIVLAIVSAGATYSVHHFASAPPVPARTGVAIDASARIGAPRQQSVAAAALTTASASASAAPSADAPADAPKPERTVVAAPAPASASVAASPSVAVAASASAIAIDAGPEPAIAREVAVLRAARAALSRGDATGTLTLLDEYGRAFPGGALGEERDAVRVEALCASGRASEARTAAERFERAFPGSPYLAGVRSACALSPTEATPGGDSTGRGTGGTR